MDIVVFGAGSLGSLVGGLLAPHHDVTLVGRDPHVSAIQADGLRISGELKMTVHPTARLDLPDSAELVIVCVKGFDTERAAAALSECAVKTCLSLQNGVDNEAILSERLSTTVLAGTCTCGAVTSASGEVRCTGLGEVVLGDPAGGPSDAAERVGTAFERSRLLTTAATDMPRRLWRKLAVNAGINPTTALAGVENSAVQGDDLEPIASEAARETAMVARQEGIELRDEPATRALDRVVSTTATNTSSMRQDLDACRRTEIDSLNGHVVDRADEHGLSVPINRTLAGLVRAWESERGLR